MYNVIITNFKRFMGDIMASRIEWNDEYLLGINEIDLQHKQLLKLANDLYDVTTGNLENYKLQMPSVLKKLTDYTEYHFKNEEDFMEKHGYIGTSAHKMAHKGFINEVGTQIKLLSVENVESATKFYDFIVGWVLTHIAKADKVWATFVKSKM